MLGSLYVYKVSAPNHIWMFQLRSESFGPPASGRVTGTHECGDSIRYLRKVFVNSSLLTGARFGRK